MRRSGMRFVLLVVVVAACGDTGTALDEHCHFATGRACSVGEVCFGGQGNECNYYACASTDAAPSGTALACTEEPFTQAPGGPFDCDPANLAAGAFTPPPAPCGLGGLWTIENGAWGRCVHASQCVPLPCEPAFGDEGCVVGFSCDAATQTCQPD